MSGADDADQSARRYTAPYSPRHPIPTIGRYREEKERRQRKAGADVDEPSKTEQAKEAYRDYRNRDDEGSPDGGTYEATNKNTGKSDDGQERLPQEESDNGAGTKGGEDDEDEDVKDTSETVAESDPRARRKNLKKKGGTGGAEREVTDPVTHLPVTIHDFTRAELKKTPENESSSGTHHRTATGLSNKSKSEDELHTEQLEGQESYDGMERLFPSPDYERARQELARIYNMALTAGMGLVLAIMVLLFALERLFDLSGIIRFGSVITSGLILLSGAGLGALVIGGLRGWTENKVSDVWTCELWESERQEGRKKANSQAPESTQWLNSFLSSVWPLVNPDLFASLADTLEDVMQASLPALVRMVSVEDIGQGSEAIRILGIRWLPTGAAARSVSGNGKLKSSEETKKENDRSVPGQGEVKQGDNESAGKNDNKEKGNGQEQDQEQVAEGMEAEEGDFVNLEVAFAYHARAERKSVRNRSKNAHLYLAFYLPSRIKFRKSLSEPGRY